MKTIKRFRKSQSVSDLPLPARMTPGGKVVSVACGLRCVGCGEQIRCFGVSTCSSDESLEVTCPHCGRMIFAVDDTRRLA
jgi:hypothetical protein